jgi:O-methyltransferase
MNNIGLVSKTKKVSSRLLVQGTNFFKRVRKAYPVSEQPDAHESPALRSELHKMIKTYGTGNRGAIGSDSLLHKTFLLQTYPDYLVTQQKFKSDFEQNYLPQETYPWFNPLRSLQYVWFVNIANQLSEGDFLELGVWHGVSAKQIWNLMDKKSDFYCFDTFEGFVQEDVKVENELFQTGMKKDFLDYSDPSKVRDFILDGAKTDQVKVIKGWIPDSLTPYQNLKFRFAHIDLDLYSSTVAALEYVWPRLVEGGVLLLDDYGCSLFPGVKKAVDTFFEQFGLTPIPLFDKNISAVVIKPKTPKK